MLIVRYVVFAISLCAATLAQAESVHAQLDVLTQLEEIRAELQTLRGDLEVNQHKLTQLEEQQRNFYNDLDQRITALSNKTQPVAVAPIVAPAPIASAPIASAPVLAAPAPVASAPVAAPVITTIDTTQAVATVNNAGNDLAAYQAAYQLLQNKQYTEASAAFNAYLQAYPQGEYVANVDYWLGEIYLIQQNYPQAEQAFSRVVNQYPAHQKSADALLKLGYVYEAMGDQTRALATLDKVQQQYAGTAVAHLAQTKATQIRQQQI
jgi:tol-pal system protein YbgF